MNWKFYTGIGIIAAFLIFALGWCSKPCPEIKETSTTTTKTKTTTLLIPVLKFYDTAVVRIKYKTKTINYIDTSITAYIPNPDSADFPLQIDSTGLYITPAFEMGYHNISTTTRDTHEVKFYWPERKILFTEYPAPREKVIEYKEIFKEIIKEKQKAWYEAEWFQWTVRGACFIGGVYVGMQVGGSK